MDEDVCPQLVAGVVGRSGSEKVHTSRLKEADRGGAPLAEEMGKQLQQRTGTEIPKTAFRSRLAVVPPGE